MCVMRGPASLQAASKIIDLSLILRRFGSLARKKKSARPVEWHLVALCTVVILPILGFVGLLLWHYTSAERQRLQQQGIELLHNVTVTVEKDLAVQGAMIELAAHSPALLSEDLASIRPAMSELARALDMRIMLRSTTGDVLFNSARPQDPSLGRQEREEDRLVLSAKRPVASNLFSDPSSPDPLVAITAPVMRLGTRDVVYLLSFGFSPRRISHAISREAIRPGALALVLDGGGRVIATSAPNEIQFGQALPAATSVVAGVSGPFQAEAPDGTRLVGHYRRLNGADWTIVAALDEEVLAAPMWRFLLQLGTIGLTTCLLSLVLALTFGGRIARAIGELRGAAAALERGGPVAFSDTSVTQVNEAGRALSSAAHAIGRSQERQAFLNRELHHRVKNNLATVQAVVNSVARSSDSLASFKSAIYGRLGSLAKTHDLLVVNGWHGASLKDILESELQPYRGDGAQRVELAGPPVQLSTDAALPVAMLVHELVTNAVKYGALSVPSGRLRVTWVLSQDTDTPVITLDWVETGGPRVHDPAREGFGSKLLERVSRQLNGTVTREFAAEGLRLRLTAPLPEPTQHTSLSQEEDDPGVES